MPSVLPGGTISDWMNFFRSINDLKPSSRKATDDTSERSYSTHIFSDRLDDKSDMKDLVQVDGVDQCDRMLVRFQICDLQL